MRMPIWQFIKRDFFFIKMFVKSVQWKKSVSFSFKSYVPSFKCDEKKLFGNWKIAFFSLSRLPNKSIIFFVWFRSFMMIRTLFILSRNVESIQLGEKYAPKFIFNGMHLLEFLLFWFTFVKFL